MFKALHNITCTGQKKIRLLVLGDGNLRNEVESLSKKYFPETDFYGYLSYSEMFPYLMQCDIAINPFKKGTANSVVNKVGDYAAAGVPVLNTQECAEYRNLV